MNVIMTEDLVSYDTPVAVIDIGSNSVRLVVYESLSRSPTVLYNEKVLCGLGRGLSETGKLSEEAIERAVMAVRRFRKLTDQIGVSSLHVMATAAAREAENGDIFIQMISKIAGVSVDLLSGKEEAYQSALGILSGIWHCDGIVGDLGGGSLELIDIRDMEIRDGETLPLGGLRLQELSQDSVKQAQAIAAKEISQSANARKGRGRVLYAIGGTWRSLAKLHMYETGYPLRVMHSYEIEAEEMLEFCELIIRSGITQFTSASIISKSRKPLLSYGATVMAELLKNAVPRKVMMSALGVREGLLYGMLPDKEKERDPLLAACEELAILRSRSLKYARELGDWSAHVIETLDISETDEEARLRTAACLLSDIGWRTHPDYRGEQSLNIVAYAAFIGIDHPGRAYLALSMFYYHMGLVNESMSPRLRELASTRLRYRARILGAILRLANVISASEPDIISNIKVKLRSNHLVLVLPQNLSELDGERLRKRLFQLARLVSLEAKVDIKVN